LRITSIDLENFRSHSRYSETFEKGINLILGRNGSGKSSIIEAIGLALFGGGLRDKQEDAIKWNERRSKITVTFLADDGLEYRVEKVFGTGSSHELHQGELLIARGKENVIEKIRIICGLQGDISKTFENVIVAFQNRIADQFLGSPAARRDYFNRVFQVDLYRKISTDFMRSYLTDLRSENETLEREIAFMEQQLERKAEVEERMKTLSEDLSRAREELKSLEDALKKVKAERLRLEEIGRELSSKRGQFEQQLKSLRDEAAALKGNLRQRERAVEAREIIDKSRDGHDLYERLLEKENALSAEKRRLEGLGERSAAIEKRIAELQTEVARLSGALLNSEERLEESEKQFEELKKEREELRRGMEAAELEAGKKREAHNLCLSRKEAFKVILEEYRKPERRLAALEDLLRSLEETEGSEELNERLAKIDSGIERAKEEVLLLEKLNEACVSKASRRKALEEYRGSLAVGICPLLDEKCKNIENRSDYEGYIEGLINQLASGERELSKKIAEVKESPSRLGKLAEERALALKAIEETDKKLKEKADLEKEKLDLEERAKSFLLQLSTISGKSGEIDEMSESVEKDIRNASTELELQKKHISTLKNQIEERDSRLEEVKSKIKSLNELKKKTEEELASRSSEIDAQTSIVKEFAEELGKLPGLRAEIEEIRRAMVFNKSDYERFNKYVTLAGYLEEYSGLCRASLERCRKKAAGVTGLRKEIIALEKSFDYGRLEELKRNETKAEESYALKRDETISIGRDIVSLRADLKNFAEMEENKKLKKRAGEKTSRKIKLAEMIRDNLNLTGERITAGFRDAIERKATLDYQRISGTEESIRWNEDYEVSVKASEYGDGSVRSFSNLSGGEQVLVSLCLRAAMTGVLSGARFAVFDEPTSNLDKERKELLAHSLRELFGELDQSIIVTHDDVFSEMAQKVIRLNGRNEDESL